jgi:TRAP-type C4-dicarboxylate transport system permease small subunit
MSDLTASPNVLTRVSARVERTLSVLLAFLLGAMVVDVTWQVASRFLLHSPSSFTEELAGFLLIWIGLLGGAYGIRTRAHLGIDLVVSKLEGVPRRAAEVCAHVLVLLFALTTLVFGGSRLVVLAFELDQTSAAMGVRMGVVYLALPLSGLIVSLFSLEAVAARRREGEEG